MWMPGFVRKRRARIAAMQQDAQARAEHAEHLTAVSRIRAGKSADIARQSVKLYEMNNIAGIVADSLGISVRDGPGITGKIP